MWLKWNVTQSLYEMTRKNVKQNWKKRQQKVFEELKQKFTIELVLVIPDLDKEMRIEVNVSDFTMNGVLLMKCENEM